MEKGSVQRQCGKEGGRYLDVGTGYFLCQTLITAIAFADTWKLILEQGTPFAAPIPRLYGKECSGISEGLPMSTLLLLKVQYVKLVCQLMFEKCDF